MDYRFLRALHGYTALALAALLALYAVSGWLIVHRMQLGRPTERSERVALEGLAGAAPLDAASARAFASEAAARAGLPGARARGARPVADGAWQVTVARVARSAQVTLRPAEGAAELKLRDAPFDESLKRLHFVTAEDASGAKLLWVVAIDVLSLALIGFAVTGALLFWKVKRDRRLGLALLAASSLYTLASIAWLAGAR